MTDDPRDGAGNAAPAAKRRGRRLAVLAAGAAALAIGAVAFITMTGRPSAPVIALAGVIQGDVRVQQPGSDRWRPLGRSTGPIVAGTRVRATPNGRAALTMQSGVSVRIDASSELTLVSASALELDRGTAYVDTGTQAPAGTFRVMTALGRIEDAGTQFEVVASDGSLRVRVRDGVVQIEDGAGNALPGAAGEQIWLDAEGNTLRSFVPTYGADWAWVETLAQPPDTQGEPLLELLQWVARETGRDLGFDTPTTASRAGTTVISVSAGGLMPMEALDVVLSTTRFDYSLRRDGTILVAPR